MKKMLTEGNQIHNFISSPGSSTVINYGSGSGPQVKKFLRLRFLLLRVRFRFWFHNTVIRICQAIQGFSCLSPNQESTGVGSTCPTGAEPSTPRRAATGSSSSADTKTIQEVSILKERVT